MTEKIARRGIYTPDSYEPDILRKISVSDIVKRDVLVLSAKNTIRETRDFFADKVALENHYLVVNENGLCEGWITAFDLYNKHLSPDSLVADITKRRLPLIIKSNDTLAKAVEVMSECDEEFLPILSSTETNTINGILTYKDILSAFQLYRRENQEARVNLSLKRQHIKVLVKGRQLINTRRINLDPRRDTRI